MFKNVCVCVCVCVCVWVCVCVCDIILNTGQILWGTWAGGRAGVQHHGAGAVRARDGAAGREHVAGYIYIIYSIHIIIYIYTGQILCVHEMVLQGENMWQVRR